MRKFLAIWRQRGGCDYTIGCGIAIHEFSARDLDGAREQVITDLSAPELHEEIAESIEQVDLIEIIVEQDRLTIQPSAWALAREQRIEAANSAGQEAKDRAEYERLKKRFDK